MTAKKTVGELVDCLQALEALTAATEDEFLYIGSRMRDFHRRAATIAELSGSVAGTMSGKDIKETTEGLNSLMEKMALYLTRAESGMDASIRKLKEIEGIILEMLGHLDGLSGITQILRALGLSTTIQNAVLKRPEDGIRVLGDDVKKLSSVVMEKSAKITEDSNSLHQTIKETLELLYTLESSRQKKVEIVLKKTMSSIVTLNRKYAAAATAAREISDGSEQISNSIGTVVTSLQIHDITRQQFESSKEAFNKVLAGIDRQQSGDLPAAVADDNDFFMNEVLDVCISQKAPLRRTRNTFITAVDTVMENLRAISGAISGMLAKTEEIAGTDGAGAQSGFSGIEATLSSVTSTVSSLSENAEGRKGLATALELIANTTMEMTGFIKEIEEIGDDIELIAFNASVKAGRIGEEGMALNVIAANIQRVSSQAKGHTGRISEILRSVASYTGDLKAAVNSGTDDSSEIETLLSGLRGMVYSLRSINRKTGDSLINIKESGKVLSFDINEVISRINVHTYVRDASEDILGNMDRIAYTVGNMLGRKVRMETVHEKEDADEGAETVEAGPVLSGSREFGDNIELF